MCLIEDPSKEKESITFHSVWAVTESCSMGVIRTVFIPVTRQPEVTGRISVESVRVDNGALTKLFA